MPIGTVTARGNATREKVLDAALDLFLERGVVGATLEEIRLRAGVSTGSLYHHFDGKVEVAAALYARCLAAYQRAALEELRRHATPRAGITAVVRHHLAWMTGHPAEARYLLAHQEPDVEAATDAAIRELNRGFFGELRRTLTPFLSPAARAGLPFDVLVAVLIGPVHEYGRNWLAGRVRTSPERAGRLLAAAAWQSVRPHLEERWKESP
jgi:AcrR family transcriptional regulator